MATITEEKQYDIVIIGAGVTGTSLAYILARYTNVPKIAIIEQYAKVAQVNSKSSNNSQTLHVGDIETNYSLEKARSVKRNAAMIVTYGNSLSAARRKKFLFTVPKMVLAVGDAEVAELEERYKEFHHDFPYLKRLERDDIARWEPALVKGRSPKEKILALGTEEGHAVDFGMLAESLLEDAKQQPDHQVDAFFNTEVAAVRKTSDGWTVKTTKGQFSAKAVVVAAGSTSLLFAKMLGYGKEMSIVPIAGNFYFTPEVLRGKVYMMQSKKIPFAAVHGDPDVRVPGKTRFGATAKFFPVLESKKYSTILQYFRSAGLGLSALASFGKILSDRYMFNSLMKNFTYDLPFVGKRLFLPQVQKIVPSLRLEDLQVAKGYGGMRMQIIDKTKRQVMFGEGQILGEKIMFNLTPSPGASTCLANAHRDAKILVDFLGGKAALDEKQFVKDFS